MTKGSSLDLLGEVEPVGDDLCGPGRRELQQVTKLLLQLPGPKGALVGLLEIADGALLPGAEVLPVPQEEPAQAFELLGRLGSAVVPQAVPLLPADLVEGGSRPAHDVEVVQADDGLGGSLGNNGPDPLGPVAADEGQLFGPILTQSIEEGPDGLFRASLGGPDHLARQVVADNREVLLAFLHDMWVLYPVSAHTKKRRSTDLTTGLSVSKTINGQNLAVHLGHQLLDDYLAFVTARARPNTVLAVAYDLKVFFEEVRKEPAKVNTADVLAFIQAQRAPRRSPKVVRLEDGESGLAARTIKRRLSSVSGLYAYLVVRGDAGVSANPVPRSLATRAPRARGGRRGVPLIRVPRTLPRVLEPAEVDSFIRALRTARDRAMAEAMVLGGLRRCEVLGLRMEDIRVGERRVHVAEGKGGRARLVPVSARFFSSLGEYIKSERPRSSATDRVFVVLKGPNRGHPLTADGLDEIVEGARRRAGVSRLTCHQLRHTCFTRLREAGMALEAIQAQAGHASIESTRIYLHLANDWLAAEYLRAAALIEEDWAVS